MADPVATFKTVREVNQIWPRIAAGGASQADIDRITQLIADLPPELQGPLKKRLDDTLGDQSKETELEGQGQDIVDRILGLAETTSAENKQFVDTQVTPELDALRTARQTALLGDQGAVNLLGEAGARKRGKYDQLAADTTKSAGRFNEMSGDLWDELKASFEGLDQSDREALGKYMGETDPLMKQLEARGWGSDIAADPESLAAQRDVMERYKGLSTPEVTAQEKLIAEMARRNFEAQDRGNREAVMQNLAQRGLNSGTLQVANNLAAQERLGQDRTLAELGMQASAVGRSMQALEGYGGQANQLRTANDAISKFNKEGSQIAQRFQDQYAASEAARLAGLAGERQGATRETNKGIESRATTTQQEGQDMLTGNFGREEIGRGAERGAADVGYETDREYANAFGEVGARDFQRQTGVLGGATNVGQVRSGANNPQHQFDALKLALGETDLERGILGAKKLV